MVKPPNAPSAAMVLIATGNNVVQDATGLSGFGKNSFLNAKDPQIYQDKVGCRDFGEGGFQISFNLQTSFLKIYCDLPSAPPPFPIFVGSLAPNVDHTAPPMVKTNDNLLRE